MSLYPLKFKPVFKEKLWGGEKVRTLFGLDFAPLPNCGEAWALSGVPGSETLVSNGFLAGNELNELLEIYMDELVGESVYERYPTGFPVLVKLLDARDWLSVQVHPDDELAVRRGLAGGKTESWYILDADPGAQLIAGFNRPMDERTYRDLLMSGRLREALRFEPVEKGDVFHMPAGRIHALGPGIVLAEIQQTSDTTYRIYDWDRTDASGNPRELHTDEALEAIDFSPVDSVRTRIREVPGRPSTLVDTPYYTVNRIRTDQAFRKDYSGLDSFVILLATEGKATVMSDLGEAEISAGEVVLLPAVTEWAEITPSPDTTVLEVSIP